MADDLIFGAQIVPDFDNLEDELEDGDFSTEVQLEGDGGVGGSGAGGGDGGGGGGIGGIVEMLGGIGKTLGLILGVVAILSQLDTAVEFLGLLTRMLSIGLLPVIGILLALMKPFIQEFLRFIPSVMDWIDSLDLESIGEAAVDILAGLVDTAAGIMSAISTAGAVIQAVLLGIVTGILAIVAGVSLIPAAIAGVVAALGFLAGAFSDEIAGVLTAIYNIGAGIISSIATHINNVVNWIAKLPQKIGKVISNAISGITSIVPGVGGGGGSGSRTVNGSGGIIDSALGMLGIGGGGNGSTVNQTVNVETTDEVTTGNTKDLSDESKKEASANAYESALDDTM